MSLCTLLYEWDHLKWQTKFAEFVTQMSPDVGSEMKSNDTHTVE